MCKPFVCKNTLLLAVVECSCRLVGRLHYVALGHATMVGVHCVTASGCEVLDVAEPELTATVLISLELGYGSIGCLGSIESNDTSSSGAAARFVLDLGLLNFTDRPEQLDQVFVASGPRKLQERVSGSYPRDVTVEKTKLLD